MTDTDRLTLLEGGNESLSEYEDIYNINLRMAAGYSVSDRDRRCEHVRRDWFWSQAPEELRECLLEVDEDAEEDGW